ncbi:MAG TPA: site-specific integrase [Dermatophilaceae bacterium]
MNRQRSHPQVEGPLAPLAGKLRGELQAQGYSPSWSVVQLRLFAGLSCWLEGKGLSSEGITVDVLDEFSSALVVSGGPSSRVPLPGGGLVRFLRSQGCLAADAAPACGPADELLGRFRRHLSVERGLQAGTIKNYEHAARAFLEAVGSPLRLDTLDARQVTRFVVHEAARRSTLSATNVAVGLRSFLRFAYVEGLTSQRLDSAVPTVPNWRAGALPRSIDPEAARRLVASCDRRTAVGRRDHAIILCLWRLGLRAGEVAAIRLDDINWRAGELLVHGKGARDEALPLPGDVGESIAGYLRRGRTGYESRALFLRATAPLGALSGSGVRWVVYLACDRAGLKRVGAHRLRHTTAAHLLQQGASLEDVAQVLRHRNVDTTAIYAKIDLRTLSAVAQPWPGSVP